CSRNCPNISGEHQAAGRLVLTVLYCFRLHDDRVYYVSEKILKLATNIARDKLVSLGTCFGKFTKTQKFRLHITALDFLAPYAKYKVWVKPRR
ncbi:unnamed protein product, partial [Staurois parvus]